MIDIFNFLDDICDLFISNKIISADGLYKTGANLVLSEDWYFAFSNSISEDEGFPTKVLYRGFIFSFIKANQYEVQTPA